MSVFILLDGVRDSIPPPDLEASGDTSMGKREGGDIEAAALRADNWERIDDAIMWVEFAWEVSSDRPPSICMGMGGGVTDAHQTSDST